MPWRLIATLASSGGPILRAKTLFAVARGLHLGVYAAAHAIDHIHCHWAGSTATMAMVASAVSGIPWSLTAHRWDIAANEHFLLKARSACFVRFISHSGRSMAAQIANEATERSVVIHMGVSLPQVQPDRPMRHEPVFLCPANLIPVKGHRYLIDAMRILRTEEKRCALWLAGHGELRNALKHCVRDFGLGDRVRFLGALPHQQLLALYEQGDIDAMILPSVDLGGGKHEGIPVSLMEAMSYGVPVISTITGGIPELVTSDSGLLVPPADSAALAHAMAAFIDSTDLRRQLGGAGSNRVRESFCAETIAQQLSLLFAQHRVRPGSEHIALAELVQ